MKVYHVHCNGKYLGSVHATNEAEALQAAYAKFGADTEELTVTPAGY